MQEAFMDLRLRQLECFVTLAEVRNFSEAARVLYISQPTLSAQIKSLEERFGKQFLVRSGRTGVTLTEEGALLLATSREILRDIRHAAEKVQQLHPR